MTAVAQDELGTHLDWELEGVTAVMIDWFWSNLEKGFLLWHPQEHQPLSWAVPVRPGNPVGAVHVAPQTWSDGTFRNLYIRFEDPATLEPELQALIVYGHCIVAAGLGFGPESLQAEEPLGYRVHQWQPSEAGVVGRSSAIGRAQAETPEEGLVWAEHAAAEIGNWAVFLPRLYELYRVVENPLYNPYADLGVERRGDLVRYRHIS
jgi:hypothetical protein